MLAADTTPHYPIASVDNALRLLLMLRESGDLRLSQAARELGVANSTAHRLLAMLQHHGFVEQDPGSKTYRAGPTLIDIGLNAVRGMDLREIAQPVLDELADDLRETIHLATLEGIDVRYIGAAQSPRTLRVAVRIGQVRPAHCTATGRAMLATLEAAEVRALYPSRQLPAGNGTPAMTREALLQEIEDVRRAGYAVHENDGEQALTSLAVAISRPSGSAVAAICCSAPADRMPANRLSPIAAALEAGAARITARMTG